MGSSSLLLSAIGVVVLVWLGWSAIATTVAYGLAESDPESALSWQPGESTALVALADRELQSAVGGADISSSEELAKAALKSNPLEAQALRLLGLAAERQGDQTRAETLMRLAGQRSLRSTGVDAWLFDHEVAAGDLPQALDHADALLRGFPDFADAVFPVLINLTKNPRNISALVAKLGTNPPWRSSFLANLSATAPDPDLTRSVLSAIKATAAPPTAAELQAYIDRLVKDKLFHHAYLDWQYFFQIHLNKNQYLYNGDFQNPLTQLPFDWLMPNVEGAQLAIESPDNAQARMLDGSDAAQANHVLRVEFVNQRVSGALVSKLLVLPPGSYTFSAEVRAEDLQNERGVWWTIHCADGKQDLVAETERTSGTIPWKRIEVAFEVPAKGCRAQWLRLEPAARVALEQMIAGKVWYARLAVLPRGTVTN